MAGEPDAITKSPPAALKTILPATMNTDDPACRDKDLVQQNKLIYYKKKKERDRPEPSLSPPNEDTARRLLLPPDPFSHV